MDNLEPIAPLEEAPAFPPKYQEKKSNDFIWLRSLGSLAIYLALGYYIFKRWEILMLITAVVLLHELGHFFAMKAFRYKDLGIFFIPMLGAYVSGTKREVSQKESAIILLAGPLPGILLGILFYILWDHYPNLHIGDTSFYTISLFLVVLNLFNLIPVYPLDGGQLLNRVFFNEENWLSKIFMILSIGLLAWFAWQSNFPVLYIFPAMLLYRLIADSRVSSLEKRIEAEGINTEVDYEHLPDEDYWKMRKIIIEEHAPFRDIDPGPPYTYSKKEDKIVEVIHTLLHRTLLQDVSAFGKLIILIIWAASIASPWLVKMDMSFFHRFGL
jgi:Zn-dependent protease